MNAVEKQLIALVAATVGDGGATLRRTLGAILAETAPYDFGELAFVHEGRVERWALAGGAAVSGDDLVRHIAAHPATVRIDELREAEPFPGTRERLEAMGLRSLLAIPLSGAGGPEGAIVLARDYGWAFAGAPLRVLVPLASMAGLCVERSLALSAGEGRRLKPIRG